MARLTRRSLFAKTGAGAAAAGVLSVAPGLIASRHQSSAPTASESAATLRPAPQGVAARKPAPPSQIPSVAYVRDAAKGEVVLMVGTTEIVRHDLALVEYLTRCCDTGQA